MVLFRAACFPAQESASRPPRQQGGAPGRTCLPTARRPMAKEFVAKTAPVSVALIRQMMWRNDGAPTIRWKRTRFDKPRHLPPVAARMTSRKVWSRFFFWKKRPAQFQGQRSRLNMARTISRGGTSAGYK